MSLPQPPTPAKLVIGMLFSDRQLFPEAANDLLPEYGEIETVSRWFPFAYTRYYETEMGSPLFRRVLVFKECVQQSDLPGIKTFTNGIERRYMNDKRRRINIDPGILLLERFVLATGKNYTHRIYLEQGIYADLTLIFQDGGFQPLPWTYPDYADIAMRSFLQKVRRRFRADRMMQESGQTAAGEQGRSILRCDEKGIKP